MLSRSFSPRRYRRLLWLSSLADMRWASSMITRSQWTCSSPGRISCRLARSREVMTCGRSSHWFIPNWLCMSEPLITTNCWSNFSSISRCHWKVRLAGQTMSIRSTKPRSLSSLMRRPAMMVLPAPASSARRNRTLGSFMKYS